jgi:hypothetical protein
VYQRPIAASHCPRCGSPLDRSFCRLEEFPTEKLILVGGGCGKCQWSPGRGTGAGLGLAEIEHNFFRREKGDP